MCALLLVILVHAASALASMPQLPDSPAPWAPDGPINAMAIHDSTLFLGGQFGYIGPQTGSMARIDPNDGSAETSFPRIVPVPANLSEFGGVFAVEPDGDGGWYVGGSFSRIGDREISNLAHVLADGTVDDWRPAPNAVVRTMTRVGDTLVVGGAFTGFEDPDVPNHSIDRMYLAAIDLDSGRLTDWTPDVSGGPVRDMETDGSRLYVGGAFTNIDGTARSHAAAFDLSNFTLTSWNPAPDDTVNAIALDGATTYLAGAFAHVGGQTRGKIAAIDSLGLATAWAPVVTNTIEDVQFVDGEVWICGEFGSVNDNAMPSIASIDPVTGTEGSFIRGRYGMVRSFAVIDSHVYSYSSYWDGSAWHGRFTSFARDTGAMDGIDVVMDNPYEWGSTVRTIVEDGDSLLIGGSLQSVGGVERSNIGALDLDTGVATSFAPSLNDSVTALSVRDDTLYVGGKFTAVGATTRNRAAAFATDTGALTGWDPDAGAEVDAIQPVDDSVFLGGKFNSMGDITQAKIAKVDASTGEIDALWSPALVGSVITLDVLDDSLYMGGGILSVDGESRMNAAAVSVDDGSVLPWNPYTEQATNYSSPYINDVTVDETNHRVFLAGKFGSVHDVSRTGVAAVDPTTGEPTSFMMNLTPMVAKQVIPTATKVYVIGMTSSWMGYDSGLFTDLNPVTGNYFDWPYNTRGDYRTALTYGDRLILGGSLYDWRDHPVRNIAYFTPPPVNTVSPWISGTVSLGETLTCNPGSWSTDASYAFQWRRDGTNISNADDATYVLAAADTGTAATCRVTASNGGGSTTATTAAAGSGAPPSNTVAPEITGTPHLHETLSCSDGTWNGAPTSFAYQWLRDGEEIVEATDPTFDIGVGNGGHRLTCQVTTENAAGSATVSAHFIQVPDQPMLESGNGITYADGSPIQGGSTVSGDTIRCVAGSWTENPTFTYLWHDTITDVDIGTSQDIVIVDSMKGHGLSCVVTVHSLGDETTLWQSVGVLDDPPVATVLPAVIGTARSGNHVTCANASWSSRQWGDRSYSLDGAFLDFNWGPLLLTDAMVGKTLSCHESASDANGTSQVDGPGVLILPALVNLPDSSSDSSSDAATSPPTNTGTFTGAAPSRPSKLVVKLNSSAKLAAARTLSVGVFACRSGTQACKFTVVVAAGKVTFFRLTSVTVPANTTRRLKLKVSFGAAKRLSKKRSVNARITIKLNSKTKGSPRTIARTLRLIA
jgi:hypothetical protein